MLRSFGNQSWDPLLDTRESDRLPGPLRGGLPVERAIEVKSLPFLGDPPARGFRSPLSQFNCTLPTKGDMVKLVRSINALGGETILAPEKLSKASQKSWPEFEDRFCHIIQKYIRSAPVQRPIQEVLQVVLEIARSIQ